MALVGRTASRGYGAGLAMMGIGQGGAVQAGREGEVASHIGRVARRGYGAGLTGQGSGQGGAGRARQARPGRQGVGLPILAACTRQL